MSEKPIRVAGMVNDSVVDGVGLRFCLFVQGCPLSCAGCHNSATQSFAGGTLMTAEEIFARIENNPLLDGVTFSGGEPMCQAEQLLPLAKKIKQKGLHLAVYTGFLFERLFEKNAPPFVLELLSYVDVLIDGPFVLSQKSCDLKFKGSSNQRVIDIPKSLASKKAVLVCDGNWD